MPSVMSEIATAGIESGLPEHVRRRVLDEWATGVEPSDVVTVSGLLRRGQSVPIIRPAVWCGAEHLDYGELFTRIDRLDPTRRTDVPDSIDRCVYMLAALGVRGDESIRVRRADGGSVLFGVGALAAAVADRRAVAAERRWHSADPALGAADVRLVVARPDDAYTLIELLAALADGAALVVPTTAQRNDPVALGELIAERSVTHVVASPAILRRLDETAGLPSVRRWDVIGTACPAGLSERLRELSPGALTSFAYGLPEYAGAVARGPLDGAGHLRPIPGARVLVLDEDRQPVPPGVTGDLYVGGVSLAEDDGAYGFSSRLVVGPEPGDGSAGRLFPPGARACWTAAGRLVIETEPRV
ncbi:AMP-binding protein [Nocardia thraciensis]